MFHSIPYYKVLVLWHATMYPRSARSTISFSAKEQADMDKIRAEQNAAYKTAKADLELGLGGVKKALTDVYFNVGVKQHNVLQALNSLQALLSIIGLCLFQP